MSTQSSHTNNLLLINNLSSMCIGCNRKMQNSQTVSIFEPLPNFKPSITLFEGLQRISNFAQLSSDKAPERACKTCFLNTDGYLRFQTLCNKSVDNILADILHQENTKCDPLMEGDLSSESNDPSLEECTEGILEELEERVNEINDSKQFEVKVEDVEQNDDKVAAGGSIQKLSARAARRRVECKTCHKLFAWEYLRYHERIHTGELPHKCRHCGRKFSTPSNLWSHVNSIHNTELPHLCPYCGLGFKLSSPLKTHIRVAHTNERPYQCQICGKSFKTTQQHKDHLTTHSDEKPFQCEKCPKRFSLRKLLRQHAVTHAEIRPIECSFCGKRFTQKHCLRSHQAKTCEGIHRTVRT